MLLRNAISQRARSDEIGEMLQDAKRFDQNSSPFRRDNF